MDEEAGRRDARGMGRHVPGQGKKELPAEDLDAPRESPDSGCGSKHVVVVMDALEEFSTKPLEWALEHLAEPGYLVTLLGVTSWPSLPLSCKTRLDVWTLDFEDLSTMKECPEWKNDARYQKLHTVVELCEARGVVPLKKVAMGHPVQLLVLEQTTNLHATWVVFDRHHRKWSTFYEQRIPCNMVIMNGDGQADMLKVKSIFEETITPSIGSTSAPTSI